LSAARDAAAGIKPSAEEIAAHSGLQIAQRLGQRRVQAIDDLRRQSQTG
jgi:hypothetical protein